MTSESQRVYRDLCAATPTVSPRYFYDAQGSLLFNQITRTPEYYPTRCEREILEGRGPEIGAQIPSGALVVELGPGSAEKARLLLGCLRAPVGYRPVDISAAALQDTCTEIRAALPHLPIQGAVADFTSAEAYADRPAGASILVFYPGSTIGNLTPAEASAFLARIRARLQPGDRLLLGVDLIKPVSVLEAAYNDAAGITALFNRNLLAHLNARFGADFDPEAFAHRAFWNPSAQRIEMHLISLRDQVVCFEGQTISFSAGAFIHTESSYKYDQARLQRLAQASGWQMITHWTDRRGWFAEVLLAPAPASGSPLR